uniref:ShKT domain-containing protein n=1 Tax=Salvator merianae TaxID=96440 RepID=A0A8D0BQA7_SALMN
DHYSFFIIIIICAFHFCLKLKPLESRANISVELQKEILDQHNAIRRAVKPTASNMLKMVRRGLKWDCSVENTLNYMVCGENIMFSTFPSSWSDVIEAWRNKSSNFKYGIGQIDPKKDSYSYNKIGCAQAYCPEKEFSFFYVCQYCPRGRVTDQMQIPYKEGPPCGDCHNSCEDKLCTNPCLYVNRRKNCRTLISVFSCKNNYFKHLCQATCNCRTGIQ